ncbi:hypothetical protein ACLOAV_004552 [Pseudogymnoascus australis]
MTINLLPDELIVEIFRCLTKLSQLRNAILTCRRLNKVFFPSKTKTSILRRVFSVEISNTCSSFGTEVAERWIKRTLRAMRENNPDIIIIATTGWRTIYDVKDKRDLSLLAQYIAKLHDRAGRTALALETLETAWNTWGTKSFHGRLLALDLAALHDRAGRTALALETLEMVWKTSDTRLGRTDDTEALAVMYDLVGETGAAGAIRQTQDINLPHD